MNEFNEYQQEVRRTVIELPDIKDKLLKGALGIASEAGEIAGLLEKHYYQGHPLDMEELEKECGDVLWYLTYLCDVCGWSLGKVAELNVLKLRKRYRKGKFDLNDSMRRLDTQ